MPQIRLNRTVADCRRGLSAGIVIIGAAVGGRAGADDTIRFTPSITLQELYSSNILGTGVGEKPDLVSEVSPGISISEDGARSEFNLQYTPTYNHYILGNSQDRVDENLISSGKFSPITDYLDIKVDAYATETGGSIASTSVPGGTLVPTSDRVLVYLGTVTPHFTTHFGNVATIDAYYRLKSANSSDQGDTSSGRHGLSADSLTQEGQVVVGSGDTFGRLSAQANLDHSIGTGSGQNTQMTSDADFLSLQYHLDHVYSLNGTVGYQKLHYNASNGAAPFNNEGLNWTVGVQATPNLDSSAAISYGYKQGAYVPTVQITYALGPRTQIAASYIVTIQNQLQSTTQNLQYLTYDVNGRPIDSRTGLPFVGFNSIFGEQNTLFRDKPANFSVTHEFVRSAFTVAVTYETRQSITGFFATETQAGGLIQFTHEISPNLHFTTLIGYNDERSQGEFFSGGEHARIINANIFINCDLSDTTKLFATETYLRKISNINGNSFQTNQAIVGLRKDF